MDYGKKRHIAKFNEMEPYPHRGHYRTYCNRTIAADYIVCIITEIMLPHRIGHRLPAFLSSYVCVQCSNSVDNARRDWWSRRAKARRTERKGQKRMATKRKLKSPAQVRREARQKEDAHSERLREQPVEKERMNAEGFET